MTERLPPKISNTLFTWHFMVTLAGIASLACCAIFFLHREGQRAVLREASSLASSAASLIDSSLLDSQRYATSLGAALAHTPGARYALYAPDGQVLFSGPGGTFASLSAASRPPEVAGAAQAGSAAVIRIAADGERRIFAAAAVRGAGQPSPILQIEIPNHTSALPTYPAMVITALLAVLVIVMTALVNWRFNQYFAAPAVQINQAAERLRLGDWNARAPARGPRELQQLAHTLNALAGSLQTNLEAMQSFVANASHELRTPLTSIKLQVGALRAGAVEEPEVAGRFLAQLDCEIDRLVYTVNEMLDLSQIEGGSLAGAYQPVDLLDLACEVQAFWEARSQQAGLDLNLQHDSPLPPVTGDPFRLRRLFDNLVDNALKNTPPGGRVSIVLQRCGQPGWVRFEIRDTGTGIEAHHLRHIFDRFYRVNPSIPMNEARCPDPAGRRSSGSGLGLAIARSIVQAHNGHIGVESSLGSGSIFWVELPVWSG